MTGQPNTYSPRPMGAGAPLSKLGERLARTGAGPLFHGRLGATPLAVLALLCLVAHPGTGVYTTTAAQLAARLGRHEATVRRGLRRLERLGVLTWRRGTVVDGAPTPSTLRVNKTALAALVDAGHKFATALDLAHAIATRLRVANLGTIPAHRPAQPTIAPRQSMRTRSAAPDSPREGTPIGRTATRDSEVSPAPPPAPYADKTMTDTSRSFLAAARAAVSHTKYARKDE